MQPDHDPGTNRFLIQPIRQNKQAPRDDMKARHLRTVFLASMDKVGNHERRKCRLPMGRLMMVKQMAKKSEDLLRTRYQIYVVWPSEMQAKQGPPLPSTPTYRKDLQTILKCGVKTLTEPVRSFVGSIIGWILNRAMYPGISLLCTLYLGQ